MSYRKTVLDNGLRVLTSCMPHTRSVSVAFFVSVGSRYESDDEGGASHFIEHMLFKGTEKRPTARDIALAIEGIGGVLGASTGQEATVYWAKVPQPHLEEALDVLVDLLCHAKFYPAEVERERRVIVEEINLTYDTPSALVYLLNNQLLWPDHPLGRDIAGTKESVEALSRETLLAFLSRHYRPNNTVVGVAGNVEHGAVVEWVAAHLGGWAPGEVSSFRPADDDQAEPRLRVQYKETEQAHLCLSVPGLPRDHPDRFNLRLLSCILGEGMSSRLFTEIREKRGLAYSVDSYLSAMRDAGAVGVYAGTAPERLEDAVEAILGELDGLRREEVPAEELTKAKEFVKGRILLQMENSFSVAAWFGQQEALSTKVLTVDEALAAIDAVTPADVQRVARGLFQGDRLNLAVVGPLRGEEKLRRLLKL